MHANNASIFGIEESRLKFILFSHKKALMKFGR